MNLYNVKVECTSEEYRGLEQEHQVVADSFNEAVELARAYFAEEFALPLDENVQALKCEFVADDVVLPASVPAR